MTPLISQCPNPIKQKNGSPGFCLSRLIAVEYHEVSSAHFNADGKGREDGHDVQESYLDTDRVWCRDCHEPRTLTRADLKLIGEYP